MITCCCCCCCTTGRRPVGAQRSRSSRTPLLNDRWFVCWQRHYLRIVLLGRIRRTGRPLAQPITGAKLTSVQHREVLPSVSCRRVSRHACANPLQIVVRNTDSLEWNFHPLCASWCHKFMWQLLPVQTTIRSGFHLTEINYRRRNE